MFARYYSSGLGRFMAPDPSGKEIDILNPQSWNGYSYVLNNPIQFFDPDGLETRRKHDKVGFKPTVRSHWANVV